jgi:hypothetical protein
MLRSRRLREHGVIASIGIGVRQAHATLLDAMRFLACGLSRPGQDVPRAIDGRYRSKVIGNGLRELDRFLSIMIDEVAATIDLGETELHFLRGRTNTANKLGLINAALTRDHPDHARLRALGRSRDCLFLGDGLVRRADERHGSSMTAGWPASGGGEDGVMMTMAIGSRLEADMIDIDRVCRFYGRLADDLLAACAENNPAIDHDHPNKTEMKSGGHGESYRRRAEISG